MASLANASPPIALGALDGRYRAAVAPLVDHLSEAALNRERVRVEVEWLIHLTGTGVVPGVRSLTDDEQSRCARSSRTSAPTRSPSWPRSSARPCTTSRRSSTSSSAAWTARRRRRAPHRAGPLRLHQRGHQQPLLRADGARRGHRGVAAPGDRAGRPDRRHGPRPARRAAARPHPRPAGHADHAGQGAGRPRRTGCAASCAGSPPPSTWASSTARPARTARTSPRCPTRTGRASAARSSRASA